MAPKNKETCLGCGKPFGKEYCIQCTICGLWIHHKPCSGVTDEGFKFLDDQVKATGSVYWACRSCVAYSQGITQKVRVLEREVESIKSDVRDNKGGVQRVENSIEELRRQMEKDKKELENKIAASKMEMREEWRERELRRKNIVLHRVPEAGEDIRDGEARKRHDKEICVKILEAVGLEGVEQEIKAFRRLGEKSEEDRPMVLVLRSEETKRKILEAAHRLKETAYNEVGIVPDLTNEQRREEAEMQDEAARRNEEELSAEDRSKNLKWMVVGTRGEKRMIKGVDRNPWQGVRGRGRGRARGQRGALARASLMRENIHQHLQDRRGRPAKRTHGDREAEEEEMEDGSRDQVEPPPAKR